MLFFDFARRDSPDHDGGADHVSGTLLADGHIAGMTHPAVYGADYSTVTDFARLRGWSTSVPIHTAV